MITGIVAVERSQGIGLNGFMPWPHLSGDMSWFKQQTYGHIVIMGSTTYKSIGKSLPGRINLVLSKSPNYLGDHTFSDPDVALTFCGLEYPDKDIFIIGGSKIYNLYLPKISRCLVTEIDADYQCDTFFNLNYIQNNFKNVKEIVKYTTPINFTIKEYTL